jgi:hypothetical protein
VDGNTSAVGHMEKTVPRRFSLVETMDAGEETGTPVSGNYKVALNFTEKSKKN